MVLFTLKGALLNVKIIAEAGVNHNGDLNLALELVDAAVDAGADIVKFQTFSAEELVTPDAGKAEYQQNATGDDCTQQEMLRRLELSQESFSTINDYCLHKDIEFLSTAFDHLSLDFILRLGLKRLKIPSGELTNLPYLRQICQPKLPILLSTGMSDIFEIGQAIDVLVGEGVVLSDITILHCNSAYPTPFEDVNLKAIKTLRNEFGALVGYSDHTVGIEAAIAAVAMGAVVIEKHITLDRKLEGPDHFASIEPQSFREMVDAIHNVSCALGSEDKTVTNSEKNNKIAARKSIVAKKHIKTGDFFTTENLIIKRPGSGISPMYWDEIIGRQSIKDFNKDDLIEW